MIGREVLIQWQEASPTTTLMFRPRFVPGIVLPRPDAKRAFRTELTRM